MSLQMICRRPYRLVDRLYYPRVRDIELWSIICPLFFHDCLEWHYLDQVTRQFDFRPDIPHRSLRPTHMAGHIAIAPEVDMLYLRGDFITFNHVRESTSLLSNTSDGRNTPRGLLSKKTSDNIHS